MCYRYGGGVGKESAKQIQQWQQVPFGKREGLDRQGHPRDLPRIHGQAGKCKWMREGKRKFAENTGSLEVLSLR
jgi:hypothetical protein